MKTLFRNPLYIGIIAMFVNLFINVNTVYLKNDRWLCPDILYGINALIFVKIWTLLINHIKMPYYDFVLIQKWTIFIYVSYIDGLPAYLKRMIWYLTETTHSFRVGLNRNINMFICQILFSLPISLSICLFQFHFWSINFTRKMIIWFFELSLLWPVMIPIFLKPLTKAMVTYGHIFINMAFICYLK